MDRDRLASVITRFGARFVDGIVLLPVSVVAIVLSHPHFVDSVNGAGVRHTRFVLRRAPLTGLLWLGVNAAYEIFLISSRGQTIGKRVAKIRVVDADGQVPTTEQAVVRWLVIGAVGIVRFVIPLAGILGFFGLLDFAWALWDPERQCLHDKAARTYVVRA